MVTFLRMYESFPANPQGLKPESVILAERGPEGPLFHGCSRSTSCGPNILTHTLGPILRVLETQVKLCASQNSNQHYCVHVLDHRRGEFAGLNLRRAGHQALEVVCDFLLFDRPLHA